MKLLSFALLTSVVFFASGCNSGSSILTPVGKVTTAAPNSTATPVAAATPVGATPSPTPRATPTPTVKPTVAPTAAPTSTGTPAGGVPAAPNFTAPPAPPFTPPPGPSQTAVPMKHVTEVHVTSHAIALVKSRHLLRAAATAASSNVVRIATSLGDINVTLRPDVAPANVANFLTYVNRGAYNGSFIHRSIPGFVIQGGGYDFTNGTVVAIPQNSAVANEYSLPNTRGTLAMALTGSNVNSATNQFFFNLIDNSAQLDPQQFTVIGAIQDSQGLAVMDAIGALQTENFSSSYGSAFSNVPVINYTAGSTPTANNLVTLSSATVVPHPGFFDGEQNLGNGVYLLQFPDQTYFGYYSYLANQNYIYHYDLGYEYVYNANDGQNGIYFYDFASSDFFYTSPADWPYLYDFRLKSFLYYFPNPNNPAHYTTNPRYFYDFATQQIVSF